MGSLRSSMCKENTETKMRQLPFRECEGRLPRSAVRALVTKIGLPLCYNPRQALIRLKQ